MSSAQTPKDQEDVMINLAMKQAEEQLREGKAPAQVVVHFLKLGSTRERLEQEDLEQKVRLEQAKTESLQSQKRIEDLYSNALKAMRNYSGQDEAQDDEDV
jgi:hypothetical protein